MPDITTYRTSSMLTAIILLIPILVIALFIPIESTAKDIDLKYRVLSHEISITVDIKNRTSSARDVLTLRDPPDNGPDPVLILFLRDGSKVDSVRYNGIDAAYKIAPPNKSRLQKITINLDAATKLGNNASPDKELTIEFHGSYEEIEAARSRIRRGVAYVDDGMIGPEGIYFPSNAYWYPREENELALFRAEFKVPVEFTSMSEGRWVSSKKNGNRKHKYMGDYKPDRRTQLRCITLSGYARDTQRN